LPLRVLRKGPSRYGVVESDAERGAWTKTLEEEADEGRESKSYAVTGLSFYDSQSAGLRVTSNHRGPRGENGKLRRSIQILPSSKATLQVRKSSAGGTAWVDNWYPPFLLEARSICRDPFERRGKGLQICCRKEIGTAKRYHHEKRASCAPWHGALLNSSYGPITSSDSQREGKE